MTTAPTASPSGRTVLAVVVTLFAWASAFVAIRGVGQHFSPGALALGRLLVGTAVLGLLLSRRGWVRPTAREWRLLVVCGVGWFGIYNVSLNAAERHLDAGTTAMLVNIGPILIAVFAGLLLGEGFPRWVLAGIAIAFVGVLLIGIATRSAQADLVGVLLCVVAAVTYAAGVVAQKPLLRRLPGLQVTATACAMGAVCCLPWTGTLIGEWGSAPARVDRRDRLPGGRPHRAGVQHLGLRAEPDGRRQARRHHLCRPAAGHPAGLVAAPRGATGTRARRWGRVPARRRPVPPAHDRATADPRPAGGQSYCLRGPVGWSRRVRQRRAGGP